MAEGIRTARATLGQLIADDAGKPVTLALGEVGRAISTFIIAAEELRHVTGEVLPADVDPRGEGLTGLTLRYPLGPVAAISPFNFPLNLAAHKVAPAIAAGCPVVLKPPSADPLIMLAVGEIIDAAGVPEGMVSILPMSRDLGDRMVSDDRFKLLSFTGSPAVGGQSRDETPDWNRGRDLCPSQSVQQ